MAKKRKSPEPLWYECLGRWGLYESMVSVSILTLVNAGYFFEEIPRGAQTSAPPKIPFIT